VAAPAGDRVQQPSGDEEPRGGHEERRDGPDRLADGEVGRPPHDVDGEERRPDLQRGRTRRVRHRRHPIAPGGRSFQSAPSRVSTPDSHPATPSSANEPAIVGTPPILDIELAVDSPKTNSTTSTAKVSHAAWPGWRRDIPRSLSRSRPRFIRTS